MTVEQGIGVCNNQFPAGMRVLAVDDDPTCLFLLDTLLRRCQYHVTTTSQAITALKMLRENKNNFDLVISDVHMPDMDGFKLLELVGLEMDLPVIMLSANSDPKLVMKGITHGACDYLLKPVRIEELKNIWQHVIRRKKFDKKDQKKSDNQDKNNNEETEATADQKLNKKRKDQNVDEDEDHEENGHENEDPITQKKPRVVWSVELHQKFVAAVNHLGIDKAVPKKILDLMNVEKLTRENVASHLQKYRLYLKRISTVANQQASMVAAFGSADAAYLPLSSMDGLGFHGLSGSEHFHGPSLRSVSPSGMLSRLNSPAAIGIRGIPSHGGMLLSHAQSASQSTNSQCHFQPIRDPGNNGNILQGLPLPLELDQMQSNRGVTYNGDLPTSVNGTTNFSSSGFSNPRTLGCSSNGNLFGFSNRPLMIEEHLEGAQDGQNFGDQSSLAGLPDLGVSSNIPDHGRCSDNCSNAVQSTGVQLNSFNLSDCFKQVTTVPSSRVGDSMPTMPIHLQDCKPDLRCQQTAVGSNAGQVINNSTQLWDENKLDTFYNSVYPSISFSAHITGNTNQIGQSMNTNDAIYQRTTSFNSTGNSGTFDPLLLKNSAGGTSSMETAVRSNKVYVIGQPNLHQNDISNKCSTLEDFWA